MSARRIVCIYFPNWPVQRWMAANPHRRDTLLVFYREIGGRGQIVSAASPCARRNGIRPGMPLAEARSLLRRAKIKTSATATCPAETILLADPAADGEALQQLARDLHAYSPLVGIAAEGDAVPMARSMAHQTADSLLCDVTGVAHLFGGEQAWIDRVVGVLRRRGYQAFAAVAETVGQAWALSRVAAGRWTSPSPAPSLDALPPEALRLSPEICGTLAQLGIVTIGQLRRLPRASWAARFGDEVARRLDQASGARDEPMAAVPPQPTFAAEQFLEFPLRDLETIVVVIERLLQRVCGKLQDHQYGALVWQIRLWRQRAPVLPVQIGLFEPLTTAAQLIPLVRMQLERLNAFRGGDDEAITEISIAAEHLTPLVAHQPLLFDAADKQEDRAAWGNLINRLAIRLGPERVVAPRRVASAQPEMAFRYESLVGGRAARWEMLRKRSHRDADTPPTPPLPENPAPLRPLRLFPQPVPIEVWGTDTGPPIAIVCGHQRWSIARCWGPERIETGWWRASLIRRDYWRVETCHRQWWWIYRDLKTGGWYWQGAF